MNVLLLCGYYEPCFAVEAASYSTRGMHHAANEFQRRLIAGLRSQNCRLRVISAPFIGSWPNRSARLRFSGFHGVSREGVAYVPFTNLWGWRSISRAHALREPIRRFLSDTRFSRRAVIVYEPHTPFLQAAVWAKRRAPDLRICLIVPDLPQYMNPSDKPLHFYRLCKRLDIRCFQLLNRRVSAYWLLTEPMTQALPVNGRPYLVAEGLAEEAAIPRITGTSKTFVYAGKLERTLGVDRLLNAFALISDPACRLVICGAGGMEAQIRAAARQDARIRYLGLLPPQEVKRLYQTAGVLVNPRPCCKAYTRYSFPSKIIEYLQTGLPVVSALLEGMPEAYRQLLYCPADDSAAALKQAMTAAMQRHPQREAARLQAVEAHMRTLWPAAVAGRLLALLQE